MKELKDFYQIKNKVRSNGKKTVAIACANDTHTLNAAILAASDGLMDFIPIGDKEKVLSSVKELGFTIDESKIIHCTDDSENAEIAVKLVKEGKADFIQKGLMQTSDFLRPVVNKETGIRTDRLMSSVVLLHVPDYHKLIAITDPGMVMYPDLNKKKKIISNAVEMFHALGYDKPKVSAICAIENLNPKMPETVDAVELKKAWQAGELPECIFEGPISMDIATSKEAAEIKSFDSPVAGDSDILIMPSIYAGNMLSKSLSLFAGAEMAGCVLGAQCPIALNSRSAKVDEKYYALLLCSLLADGSCFSVK